MQNAAMERKIRSSEDKTNGRASSVKDLAM